MNRIVRSHLLSALLLAGALAAAPASSGPMAPSGVYDPPMAEAGPDQTVHEDQTVTLSAWNSSGTEPLEFYSDHPPQAGTGQIAFREEEANAAYTVDATGVLPALPCGSTPAQGKTWGAVKATYR